MKNTLNCGIQVKDALLEVRVENLPSRFVAPAEEQLRRYAAEELAAAGLSFAAVEAYGTYKRLVLHITGVPARTEVPGRPAVKALAEIFPRLIARLQFPKTMTWEASRFRFARPIRGVLALYGDKPVVFSVAGVKSGRFTVGLSAKGSRQLRIASAEKYFKTLEHADVVVRDADRLALLRRELAAVSRRMKLEVEPDEELLAETLYLAEYPVCVVSDYSQDFLRLPRELARQVMRKQLKFFTVADQKGAPQPYFVGIRDGVSRGQRNVEEGFRGVLEARLRDALFFCDRGLAVPLAERGE